MHLQEKRKKHTLKPPGHPWALNTRLLTGRGKLHTSALPTRHTAEPRLAQKLLPAQTDTSASLTAKTHLPTELRHLQSCPQLKEQQSTGTAEAQEHHEPPQQRLRLIYRGPRPPPVPTIPWERGAPNHHKA